MIDYFVKKSDVIPSLQTIISGEGGAINLTNYTGVYLVTKLRHSGSATITSGRIVSASAGLVEFNWPSNGINATPGVYWGEWRLVNSSGTRTFPKDCFFSIEIISGI